MNSARSRGRRWKAGAVALAATTVLVWAARIRSSDDVPPPSKDLAAFDEIDLGSLAGSHVLVGETRSKYLPLVVSSRARGRSSLTVVDAESGGVIDAGAIPVDGWLAYGYPRASSDYVALVGTVCSARPTEGDVGIECRPGTANGPVTAQLSVYSIEAATWRTLPLDDSTRQLTILDGLEGSTAVLKRYLPAGGGVRWASVDLAKPQIGRFTRTAPHQSANTLSIRSGHLAGPGWEASEVNGPSPARWVGSIGTRQMRYTIPAAPGRQIAGAGRCMVIGSFRGSRIDHLHRICADP